MKSKVVAALVCLFLIHGVGLAADARIQLPGGGAFVLPVPEGWRQAAHPSPVTTLSFTPASGNAFQVLVSPLVTASGSAAPADHDSLRRLVASSAEQAKPQAVEMSLPVQELRAANVQGNYFSATDRNPKPGEFKYMTQGAMVVQGLLVTFTILSNGDSQLAVEPALRMLKAARRE